ncbi:hypothetical protein [Burkholderia gladioli]|uniref:hypothetical protein n=1 Tax=Burkholderia gladioli TaxID=28095 RepID=UPI00265074A7|nr:hypothetical protein [Burkholderia gladioli]MDN7749523.1 hypothetical protein [Burkholderia gladioli]
MPRFEANHPITMRHAAQRAEMPFTVKGLVHVAIPAGRLRALDQLEVQRRPADRAVVVARQHILAEAHRLRSRVVVAHLARRHDQPHRLPRRRLQQAEILQQAVRAAVHGQRVDFVVVGALGPGLARRAVQRHQVPLAAIGLVDEVEADHVEAMRVVVLAPAAYHVAVVAVERDARHAVGDRHHPRQLAAGQRQAGARADHDEHHDAGDPAFLHAKS